MTRGLPTDRTLLFVVDGAAGLRRAVRADGLFDHPTGDWSYARTGARSGEIEITWENDGRSEIGLTFSADDRGTFEQRDFAPGAAVYCGDVTRLHYRGDFQVQRGAVP